MSDFIKIENVIQMITKPGVGEKPAFWLKDYLGTRPYAQRPGYSVMQIALVESTQDEPFMGCTAQLRQFLTDHREAEVLGAMADTSRRVIDISFKDGESTHSEEH